MTMLKAKQRNSLAFSVFAKACLHRINIDIRTNMSQSKSQKQGLSPTLKTLASHSLSTAFYVIMSCNQQSSQPERKLLAYLHSYHLLSCTEVSLKVPVTLQDELSCSMEKKGSYFRYLWPIHMLYSYLACSGNLI